MGFLKIVPLPPPNHSCKLPHAACYGVGTTWQCDDCGMTYEVNTQSTFGYRLWLKTGMKSR